MKKYFKWAKLLSRWNKLHLADKSLLIIMLLLMIQTARNLFFNEIAMHDSATLDVVIRTTTAAIFGYFISANFHSGTNNTSPSNYDNKNSVGTGPTSDINLNPKARIGFGTDLEETQLQSGHINSVEDDVPEPEPDNNTQIIIIAAIGIVCLIFLLVARNYSIMGAASVATISQIRDFISGSVGFLIGQSTKQKK